ncbi:MAG: helix-turn-helix transcriptional regulator [Gordonia sp. (in: high G+C Gram-positive bacteria)]|uniref:response regulator transcription factor n=1 Tax=Gordonia sp. (in: high G+C Gram-positive bacteria) TaxID=84139 RepID=UPI0039E32DC5
MTTLDEPTPANVVVDYGRFGPVVPVPAYDRPALSEREVEVLLAWLASESKDEAAARLFISASTVSTHISRIRAKYAGVGRPAPTKAHLLARALQDGYTQLSDW